MCGSRVMSHINQSYYMWDMTQLCVGHDSFERQLRGNGDYSNRLTGLASCGHDYKHRAHRQKLKWDIRHPYVGHDAFIIGYHSFICGTWLRGTGYWHHRLRVALRHEWCICAIWPIDTCEMAHSYLGHDSMSTAIFTIDFAVFTFFQGRALTIVSNSHVQVSSLIWSKSQTVFGSLLARGDVTSVT